MKTKPLVSCRKTVVSLFAATAVVAGSLLAGAADDEKVKIKGEDGKIKIKGENAEELADQVLSPEVVARFTPGYHVPEQYRVALQPMPELSGDVVLRHYGNTVYYVDPKTHRIAQVITTTPVAAAPDKVKVEDEKAKIKDDGAKIKIKGDSAASVAADILSPEVQAGFVAGAVVPEVHRVHLRALPDPPKDVVLRYYGNNVYYLHPKTFEILRVVSLQGS